MTYRPHSSPLRRVLAAATLLTLALGMNSGLGVANAATLPSPISAPLAAAPAATSGAKASPASVKPVNPAPRKANRSRSKRLSKATLAALQPVALPAAQAVPAAPPALAHLSPMVRQRAEPAEAAVTAPSSPLARALDATPAVTTRPVSTQTLPAQEEALALARQQAAPEVAANLPEEPGARARKDVETGPMRLRVRRQAVQMSVEFPFQ